MEGYSLGKPIEAGIGGIMKNHVGRELIRFSKYVGIIDSNKTELLAVKKVFTPFLSSPWAKDHIRIIKNDSKSVVSWMDKPQTTLWRLKHIINHIENIKLHVQEWRIFHAFREAYQVVDSLAKEANCSSNLLMVNY
ncbi:hypothetical protein DITRI_Ditri15bG0083200 [Diplodiscus trichospermus]